jgi:hypothetical protein
MNGKATASDTDDESLALAARCASSPSPGSAARYDRRDNDRFLWA